MKTKILSIALSLALTASLGLLGKVGCDRAELQSANDQLNAQLMQADLELGRALTRFDSAEKYIDQLEGGIQDEIKERDAIVTRYGELELEYYVLKKKKRGKTTRIVYKDKPIEVPVELKLEPGMYYEASGENSLKPIGEIFGQLKDHRISILSMLTPHSTAQGGAVWDFDYRLNLKFELQFAETHLPSGGINHYATMYEVDKDGKRVQKLKVKKFTVVVEKPDQKQWFWWAPHVDIGGLVGARLMPPDMLLGGSVGFSPFAYGLTVNDLDWRFLRVSLDLAGSIPGFGITPVVYNLGQPLPLLSNLWIGIHVGYLPPEDWALSLFVGAVL